MSDGEYGSPEWHDLGNCEYPGCSKMADERLVFSDEFLWQAEMSLCNEHVEKQRNEFYKMGRDPNRYRNSKRYRLIFDYSSDVGHVPKQLIRKWFTEMMTEFESQTEAKGVGNFQLFHSEMNNDDTEKRLIQDD